MNLKSLEGVLEGVGKLRAASVVAALASTAAVLGLSLSPGVQESAITGVTVLIAVINVVDGYIRGQHARALPALIAQGAESVAKVEDPRVDDVAASVATIASRLAAVENGPKAPSLQEIIAGLTGKNDAPVVLPAAPVVAEAPAPAAATPPVPAA